jgi:AP endonuclease 1
MAAAPAPA